MQNCIYSFLSSAHKKFKALAPEKVGHNKNAKLPMSKILQYPELRVNPFGDRICKVFSSSQDGDCTFEDFLDVMSVFSDTAPKTVKAEHVFRIFDFDGDDMLGVGDLRKVVDRLTTPQRLNDSDMHQLLQYILDEADLDDDGALNFAEFEHITEKSSDFSNNDKIFLQEFSHSFIKVNVVNGELAHERLNINRHFIIIADMGLMHTLEKGKIMINVC
ncbi:Uncharacterized protein DBV15_12092 [Temnothorax longispinosus]|uniref:EF-hand domain-containing protein n=1 Tax=Temnothorax longispinosus TaxID=300112 RepID=A0A4S2KT30_9HYME|nr:Uncharacterized protein DBV15_12092 [Temnothorax longispinosus]